MFRHVVLFSWAPQATEEQKRRVAEELRKLPGQIEEIVAYHVGPDAGVNAGNHDFAVVADFADREGYIRYRDHELHRAVVERHIRPIMAGRAAVQYEIDG